MDSRNSEELEQLRVPLALHDVEEQSARGIGHVGHVLVPAGQVPDEPAIHGAEGQLAALGTRPRAGHVIQNPLHLGRGKIRIEHQAGLRLRRFLARAALLEFFAEGRRPPVLPHNGRMNRLARRALPHNHRLALVGNADRRHVARPRAHLRQGFDRAAHLAGENLRRIVLYPSRLRIELLELLLRHRGNRAGLVKQNRPRTRRPLVQRQNVCHTCLVTFPATSQTREATRGQGAE
jgi:hypothetical protein